MNFSIIKKIFSFKKIIPVIILLVGIGRAQAQNTAILPEKVSEGDTSFLTVITYDENNQPVQSEKIWFTVLDAAGNLMQETRALGNGGTGDTAYFSPNTDTASNMNLMIIPCANRMAASGLSDRNVVSIWFAYPHGCSLSQATPGPTVCKWGTGSAVYEKTDQKGIWVQKGTAACGSGWANIAGCPVPTRTVGLNCDGLEGDAFTPTPTNTPVPSPTPT